MGNPDAVAMTRKEELAAVIAAFWGSDQGKRPTMQEYKAALDEHDVLTGVWAEQVRRRALGSCSG